MLPVPPVPMDEGEFYVVKRSARLGKLKVQDEVMLRPARQDDLPEALLKITGVDGPVVPIRITPDESGGICDIAAAHEEVGRERNPNYTPGGIYDEWITHVAPRTWNVFAWPLREGIKADSVTVDEIIHFA